MATQNQQSVKPFDEEILDVKKQSLYARLKRLFSTDVIVRNVGGKQLKIKDTDSIMYATDRNSLRDRFNRIRSTAYNAYTRDFALSYQAARMDLFRDYDTMDMDPILSCLAPTTYVSTLDGFVAIKDLAEKYPNGEYFKVWSWDKDTHKLTLGNAHHPRKTGTKNVIELHLDNGEIVKCTPDHRMMLVNGTYKEAGKLLSGESLMPFYHRINDSGYQEIKSLGKRFKPMHRYIFEDVLFDTDLDGYNIHHKNHNKLDNRLENLEKMTALDHMRLHHISPITNGKRSHKITALWENAEYRDKCSSALKRWQDSDEGHKFMSEHTSILNQNRWKNNSEYAIKMAQIFSEHATSLWNNPEWKEWKRKKHSETMKLKYANDPTLSEKTKHVGKENGRYKDNITTESILTEGIKCNSLAEFARTFDFKGLEFKNNQYRCQFLSRRIKESGYNGWTDYKNKFVYSNHKVIKIVDNNEVIDVYDLTVDFYENFALKQGIICSNSALDIYADECLTYNEMGKMITVHSNNNNVKRILENLFDKILNVRFNLWSWTRNMPVKYDSYIPLLDGRNIRIDELSKEIESGKEMWVYSIQDVTDKIVPGKVIWCGKNYTSDKIVKVVFDDDSFVESSPEHPFVMRDGTIKRADELLKNDSLMPFYRKLSSFDKLDKINEYELIYNPSIDKYDYTHRLVASSVEIKKNKEKRILHHKDFNKYNNSPSNLMAMDFIEHKLLHAKHCKRILHTPEVTKKRMAGIDKYLRSSERRDRLSKEMSGIPVKYFTDYNNSELHKIHNINRSTSKSEMWKDPLRREAACRKMKDAWAIRKKQKLINHKVKYIEIISEMADVYCMTVVGPNGEHDRHNFAICGKDTNGNITNNSGVFVKNCKYGDFYLKLYITPEYGIYMVEPISAYNVERIENSDPDNKRYVKFQLRPTDTSQAEILENYEVAHFRLISDSNFLPYGKCLTSNSYVKTEFGSKRINEIEVGDKVWSFNKENEKFELTPVLNKCSSGVKDTLKISSQHNEIECSDDHPILVYSNNVFEYKKSQDLSTGDLLVLFNVVNKSRSLLLNKTLLTEGNHNGWKNNILTLPSYPDAKFARFFGFMLGDGWLNKDLNRVSFAAGADETLNERYSSLLGEYSKKEFQILPPREGSGGQRYVDSKLLAEFLYVNGFVGDATTKRIPQWAYELDDWSKLEFIRGFVDADGSIFTDKWNVNRYAIELTNKPLVEDIKEFLRGLNIKCSNVKSRRFEGDTEICGIKCHRNTSHYIYFYLDGNKKTQLQKYDFVKNEDIILDPITKIEIAGEQETYDIQVESSNSNFIANGIIVHNSMIEGGRRVWKQLSLMEDAMLISRIMRAPERRIFYTDIGNIPPNEVDAYMQKMMDKMKKVPYIDEQTGEYNLRFNLQNMIEDYYIPVRGGDSGTKIDTLAGMEWTGIDDLEYIKTKMMAALKIPKAFLGFEEGISGKATLASEDVRFARTIQRLQRIIASELSKIAIVHLYAQGYRDESLVDFELELTNPSTIFEKEKLEIWQDKLGVAIDMVENKFFSLDWIYKNIFNMSEDDAKKVKEEVVEDTKQRYRLTKIEEEGDDPAKPFKKIGGGKGKDDDDDEGGLGDIGLGGGGGGGSHGGGSSLPDLDDLGGDEGEEDKGEGEGEEGDEGEDKDKDEGGDEEPDLTKIKEVKETKTVKEEDTRDRSDRDQSGRDQSDRDQEGEKKAPNMTEDPLGRLDRSAVPKKKSEGKKISAITHNFEGGSPLNLRERTSQPIDKGMISSLSNFLKKTQPETKKELLRENQLTGSKSMMDETQILE